MRNTGEGEGGGGLMIPLWKGHRVDPRGGGDKTSIRDRTPAVFEPVTTRSCLEDVQ